MRPSRFQRLVASDVLIRVWLLTVPCLVLVFTLREIDPTLSSFTTPSGAVWTSASGLLAFVAGYFLAILVGWPLFGPFLMWCAEANGGPFAVGDRVMVLAGPYADRVSIVYSMWQHDAVRVDLGEDAKSRFADIYGAYQLVRVIGGELNGGEMG